MHTRLFNDHRGAEATEYIVIGAILVLLLAIAFVTLFNTLQQKLLDVNDSL